MNRRHKKILDSYLAGLPPSRGDTPWRPAADVLRTNSGWLIKLELAGVDPNEVDVFVEQVEELIQNAIPQPVPGTNDKD